MVTLGVVDGVLQLKCDKQKDGKPFSPIALSLVPRLDSCVLIPVIPRGPNEVSPRPLTNRLRQALTALAAFGTEGATHTEWKEAFMNASGLGKSSFDRALRDLKGTSYIRTKSDKGRLKYAVTEEGAKAVGVSLKGVPR
jgi:hypothetical protein